MNCFNLTNIETSYVWVQPNDVVRAAGTKDRFQIVKPVWLKGNTGQEHHAFEAKNLTNRKITILAPTAITALLMRIIK